MEKKEIGKLLELLNEYDDGGWQIRINDIEPIGCDVYAMPCGDSIEHCIISKSYGFIQRLVEQDKIDRDKKEIEKSDYDITFTGTLTMDKKSDGDIMVDTLLMLLSISEQPIELLISILK